MYPIAQTTPFIAPMKANHLAILFLNNVEFIGHIKNETIPEFLSKAFCLLNTSRLEGFSNTFLEAWSVGTPVITTKNVNPDEIISDYSLGIVSENYDEIPKILKKLIEEKQYMGFSKTCSNYVKDHHDPIKLAKIFLQDMKNCLVKT